MKKRFDAIMQLWRDVLQENAKPCIARVDDEPYLVIKVESDSTVYSARVPDEVVAEILSKRQEGA